MGYCFAREDASVEDGFRRIATELFDKAIGQAEKAQAAGPAAGDETIHELRKHCKKLRGLYRLVRPVFDGYAVENAAMRDAAGGLSSARDAEVLVQTFDWLVGSVDPPPEPVAAIRAGLLVRREALAGADNAGEALACFRDTMAAARRRARRWRLDGNGFDALAEGIETGLARARRAMRQARSNGSPEAFHEWRKRAKDHWYHARLLVPMWPEALGTHVRISEQLGELLGRHHDLCVLRDTIVQDRAHGREAADLVRVLAERREADIAAASLAIGARLLAEEPQALVRRWRAYWKCWRAERQGVARKRAG